MQEDALDGNCSGVRCTHTHTHTNRVTRRVWLTRSLVQRLRR
jgi:hypothetical protein